MCHCHSAWMFGLRVLWLSGVSGFPWKGFFSPSLGMEARVGWEGKSVNKVCLEASFQSRFLQGIAGNATLHQDPGRDWTMVSSEKDSGFIDWVLSPRGTSHFAILLSEDNHSDFTQHHGWKRLISKDLLNALNTSSSWIPVCKEMFHIILDHRNVWWQFNSLLLCNV